MPARAKKIGNKWRVVEPDGSLVLNRSGSPVDGGGSRDKDRAVAQAQAINLHQRRKKRKR